MAWSLPHTGIIGSQKTLRLQDLLILATDTESLHPDIDTDIVLSTDFSEIHPWLVVWHGNEVPVLQYLHDHNYVFHDNRVFDKTDDYYNVIEFCNDFVFGNDNHRFDVNRDYDN